MLSQMYHPRLPRLVAVGIVEPGVAKGTAYCAWWWVAIKVVKAVHVPFFLAGGFVAAVKEPETAWEYGV